MTRTRSLEIWHIPKRQNIHQIIGSVEILSQDNFNGKSWTSMKQEAFNTLLGRHGLTERGRPLSPSARRTLEALIKYLGFIVIDNSTTPSTIHVTNAGFELLKKHGSVLGLGKNLKIVSDNGKEILQSEVVEHQMNKLQISNPVIREDCVNILLFPFRVTLRLLLELQYLSKEELGYIVFSMKKEDEFNLIVEKIKTFRQLPEERRRAEIEAFKSTEIGNLTLVQAPTAGYYIGLCVTTGLCERKLGDLYIKDEAKNEVISVLDTYKNVQPFDFGDNLRLWVEYFGDFNRTHPPLLVEIKTNMSDKCYVRVYNTEGKETSSGVASASSIFNVALFEDEEYKFDFFSFSDATLFHSEKRKIVSDKIDFILPNTKVNLREEDNQQTLERKILELINSKDYDPLYTHHVSMVSSITGKNDFNTAQLRGGRLEYLFYKLLKTYKDSGQIDDVIWNGRVDDFGIMYPALGGKEGYPDVYFFIKNNVYVLELTTIRANAMQWSAEGASVHDHIMNLQKKIGTQYSTHGIFSAPTIAPRVQEMFKHIATKEKIPHHTVSIEDLVKAFKNLPNIF
ncbi:MAG: AlwI family type II restriction endonuclease [Candidatus Pacebacteria bacterium]|jgi:hypothetical protein|nr:AlwI family type II restriction endonuclease [Candidatus Paceibacterota bacterium]